MPNPSQLALIHASVSRAASVSSALKAAAVAGLSAIAGAVVAGGPPSLALVAVYVVTGAAVTDAYYLAIERAHRQLFEREAARSDSSSWAMAPDPVSLPRLLSAFASPSVWFYYAFLGVGSLVLLVVR